MGGHGWIYCWPHLGRCGPTEWVQQPVKGLVPTAVDPSPVAGGTEPRGCGRERHMAPARKASGPADRATGAGGRGRTAASRVCAGAALLRTPAGAQALSSSLSKSCKQRRALATTSASGSLLDSRSHDPAQPAGSVSAALAAGMLAPRFPNPGLRAR